METILESARKWIDSQVRTMVEEWPELLNGDMSHMDIEVWLINYISTGCPYNRNMED